MNLMWFVYLEVFKRSFFEVFAHSCIEPQYMFYMLAYICRDFQGATISSSKSNLFLFVLNPVPPSFT